MATKYKAICSTCGYRGSSFLDKLSAKKQRGKHQKETDYKHNVGIEITEELVSFVSSEEIDNPNSLANKNKLL